MPIACLALGSNLGNRQAILDAAVSRLHSEPGSRVLAVSPWYETEPVNCPPGSQAFLNGCLKYETNLTPESLLKLLLRIEESFGRQRTIPNSPRTLDLDVLLYDDFVISQTQLTLPHPRMTDRGFVMVPLADVAGDWVHPTLKKTIRDLAKSFPKMTPSKADSPPAIFAGQSVFVTGSTSGIGATIAKAFADRGATVTTHGRRSLPGKHIVADLNDPIATAKVADQCWGKGIDILVCAAGADILTGDGPQATFDEKLKKLWQVDVAGTITIARSIGQRMKARKRGCIITIGWDQAETGFTGDSGQLFAAVKGAVMCFTRSLAIELAPEVRVNCIAPGWIRTSWGETASPVWQERVRSETPLARWGLPTDTAKAALWLADPTSSFITGQTIKVNGGVVG